MTLTSTLEPRAERTPFDLPRALEATAPPEARGLARDEVRLLVTSGDAPSRHARFRDIGEFLEEGDLFVVNTSGTRAARLRARREPDVAIALHVSAELSPNRWIVELRALDGDRTRPLFDGRAGEVVHLPAGGVVLEGPYRPGPRTRLWLGRFVPPAEHAHLSLASVMERFGEPIRYGYVPERWPIACYQTIFATEAGSAEMPSAGRPFSHRVLDELRRKNVLALPIVLHTGVSSLESGEPPYPERYRVPAVTARAVTAARRAGRRVVAVGTTVVRALESATAFDGVTRPAEGWTDLVVSPERDVCSVNGLLTGFHEPRSTHLAMLEAIGGGGAVARAYSDAIDGGYLWHEFGDVHLILQPQRTR